MRTASARLDGKKKDYCASQIRDWKNFYISPAASSRWTIPCLALPDWDNS